MRIFVTGASGWIGSAVVAELISKGHDVRGLVRSDASATAVSAAGATAVHGSLSDLDTLRAEAENADGVVHLGFNHDFSDMKGAARTERSVMTTFGDALAGSDRPLLFASGVAGLTPGRVATERDSSPFSGPDAPRGGAEALALEYAEKGVRTVALRFAPTVHGDGDHGFIAYIAGVARDKGFSAYVGDGTGRWPAVHRLDAATVVALALDKAPAGSAVHAVAEEGVSNKDIAEAIGRGSGLPVRSVDPADAGDHFGWMAMFFGPDMPVSSEATRELLGWTPTHPTLLEDLDAGYYTRA